MLIYLVCLHRTLIDNDINVLGYVYKNTDRQHLLRESEIKKILLSVLVYTIDTFYWKIALHESWNTSGDIN